MIRPRVLLVSTLLGLVAWDRTSAADYLPQFDLTPAQFQTNYNNLVPQGYRPLVITAHESISLGSVFQVVWVNDGVANWTSEIELNWADFQTFAQNQSSQGYRPICVENYGTFPNERYASIWVNNAPATPWQTRYQMSSADLQTQLSQLSAAGYRLAWISGCGSGTNKRFSGLWVQDGIIELTLLDNTRTTFKDNVEGYRKSGYRVVCATGYNGSASPQLSGVLTFTEHPPWERFIDQTLAELNATSAQYLSLDYRPTFVTAYETTGGTRYASAWEEIPKSKVWTVTGPNVPEFAAFDATMQQFMQARHIPNAAIAVTKNGRLALARAYTYAPVGWPITQPETRFRLASLSKSMTSVGVMKLIENGVIGFDQPISTILDMSAWVDPRVSQITVRQVLQHRAGWDSSIGQEPVYNDFNVSALTGQPLPTTPQMLLDYMGHFSLDHDPGTYYIYSIFGYIVLGRLIEAATGENYETWMLDNVFAPIHVYSPRIGNSLLSDQYPGEVPYYDPYQRVNRCVMGPGTPEWVSIPYGATNVHSLYSSAGWIASAVDYARFLCAFDDLDHSPLLTRPTIDLMWGPPPGTPPNAPWYYACGWNILSCGPPGQFCVGHSGSMAASATFYTRENNGVNWVALFATNDIVGFPIIGNIGPILDSLAFNTTQWPSIDLFDVFGRGDVDCDGEITLQDIPAFVLGLTDPEGYALTYSNCPTTRGDMNGDGAVNGGDIQSFADKLLSGI